MIYELKDFSKVKRMFEFWYGFDAVDATIRVFVTDPDAPPNLYLKWPNTSRIGTGIHDAASWAEAFETREPGFSSTR